MRKTVGAALAATATLIAAFGPEHEPVLANSILNDSLNSKPPILDTASVTNTLDTLPKSLATGPTPVPTENSGRPQDKYHSSPKPAPGIPFYDSLGNSGNSQFVQDTEGKWVPLGGPLANNGVTYCAGTKCEIPSPKSIK